MNIFDVHIKNGEVIDGTGAPKFKSDIVIDKGKIIGVFPPENGDVRDPSENHFLSNFRAKLSLFSPISCLYSAIIDSHLFFSISVTHSFHSPFL